MLEKAVLEMTKREWWSKELIVLLRKIPSNRSATESVTIALGVPSPEPRLKGDKQRLEFGELR